MPKKKEKKKNKKKNDTEQDGGRAEDFVEDLASGVGQLSLNQEGAGEVGAANAKADDVVVEYRTYSKEEEMLEVVALIEKDLSEPYSIFTYRYFIHNWPDLCLLVSAFDAP
jgi:peptide alpha-N-acetyltransferase